MAENLDPLDVNGRLYKQVARLLDQLEAEDGTITMPQRINALIAVGRIQTIFAGLRSKAQDEPNAGSAVRKYATAFASKTDGARGRKKPARSAPAEDDYGFVADDTATDAA